MFALRLTCPPHATDAVVSLLHRHPAATHLVLLRGAGLEPAGDVVLVDLAREAVSEVLGELRALPGGADWPFAGRPMTPPRWAERKLTLGTLAASLRSSTPSPLVSNQANHFLMYSSQGER